MHWPKIKIFGIILLFIQGCAPIPKHEMAKMMESCDCDHVAAQVMNGDFAVGDWPRREWWKDFKDPVLDWLIEAGLELSPTLKRAEARLKSATQVAVQRRAALFPEMDFDAEDDWQHLSKAGFFRAFAPTVPPLVNDVTLGFSFSYEFDFWGKNRALFRAALGEAAALAAERMQAELIMTTSIAYTYAELQFLLFKRQILEKMQWNDEEISSIRLKRLQNALDTSMTPLRSHADTLDIKAMIVDAEQQIEQEVHKLKALTGLSQDVVLDIQFFHLSPLQVAIPERLSLDLTSRRPDLIAQKARVEASAKEIHAAKTDFYPNVNLTAFVGLESVFWPKLFRGSSYSGYLDPAINLPIFTAGRLKGQLMEKVANFDAAVFAYNELILQAAQEVADRLTDIFLLQKQIDVRRLSLETRQEEEKITERRFEHAIEDQIALLDAKNVVLDSELTLASLEYGKQLANILLIRSLGGGYP
jgi:NodT family efflux transporter outer membrane factor (OMF) lipoprotein